MMKKRSIRTGILFALLTPVLLICAENPIYAPPRRQEVRQSVIMWTRLTR